MEPARPPRPRQTSRPGAGKGDYAEQKGTPRDRGWPRGRDRRPNKPRGRGRAAEMRIDPLSPRRPRQATWPGARQPTVPSSTRWRLGHARSEAKTATSLVRRESRLRRAPAGQAGRRTCSPEGRAILAGQVGQRMASGRRQLSGGRAREMWERGRERLWWFARWVRWEERGGRSLRGWVKAAAIVGGRRRS